MRSALEVSSRAQTGASVKMMPPFGVSKLTDCDGECNETDSSLDFAKDCGYISVEEHSKLTALNTEVGKMLGSMLRSPEKFTPHI